MKRLTGEDWAKHFERFSSSGMSVAEYTKKHGLGLSKWYYWRKVLPMPHDSLPSFVPVIANDKQHVGRLNISLANGLSLSFAEDVNLVRLGGIVKALLGAIK